MSYYSGYRRKRHRGFDFGEFEITKRKIIASVTIIAVLLLIGVLISSKISEHQMDKNEIYNKTVKIQSSEQFQYGMDTNVGNAFVYGDLEAVDTVSYSDIVGEYILIAKTEEHYNRHTRRVAHTRTVNGKSQTYYTTETYWTWDFYDYEEKHADKISFLGIEFDYGKIDLPGKRHIDTVDGGYHVRYVYEGVNAKLTGTIFTCLRDNTISENTSFYENSNIEETVERLESGGGVVIFWIFWIILIGGCVFGFYYIDNEWLEN